MIRISGITIPDTARLEYGLTMLYGVGPARAKLIMKEVGIKDTTRVRELSEEDVRKIQFYIDQHFKVEGNLKLEVSENIKRLREIHSYRGYRHMRGLPVRGQRTKSNARTRKGRKHTVGALSKEAWAKIDQVQTAPVKSAAK